MSRIQEVWELLDFEIVVEEVESGVLRYQLYVLNQPVTFRQFINALASDKASDKANDKASDKASDTELRQKFNSLLTEAPFEAYRIETPALSLLSLDDPFEFVLINAPALVTRTADALTFAQYFKEPGVEVVEFKSLGGDAILLAPTPVGGHESYNHLAVFVRNAPESQVHSLWQMVGQVLMRVVSAEPRWFNTEGSGVAWLHVRIDSRPKYYGYQPYKVVHGGCGPEGLK